MKHHNKNRKFGREKNQRNALIKGLMYAIIRDEGITTTEPKAKEVRPHVERLITNAKKQTLASMRSVEAKIGSKKMVQKLVKEIAPKYAERAGGYTRIIKLPLRKSDGAKMARIELV